MATRHAPRRRRRCFTCWATARGRARAERTTKPQPPLPSAPVRCGATINNIQGGRTFKNTAAGVVPPLITLLARTTRSLLLLRTYYWFNQTIQSRNERYVVEGGALITPTREQQQRGEEEEITTGASFGLLSVFLVAVASTRPVLTTRSRPATEQRARTPAPPPLCNKQQHQKIREGGKHNIGWRRREKEKAARQQPHRSTCMLLPPAVVACCRQ